MSAGRRRVVVTGLGVVSAGGCDIETFWRTLVSGASSIGRIGRFDVSAYPTQMAGEIRQFDPFGLSDVSAAWKERGRIAGYAAVAADRAVRDARLARPGGEGLTGVSVAAGLGSYEHGEVFGPYSAAYAAGGDFDWRAFTETLRRTAKPRSAERRTPGSIAALLAEEYGFAGPVMSVMTACAGGTHAIGDAVRWIRRGRADTVLAGAADSELYPMGLASFCLLGALSRRNAEPHRASRPFDRERDGFVIGEGAGMLVLEEREQALRRGARIYAEIAGFGSAADGYRVTDPHPDGAGALQAMRRALADAGLPASAIDYVNAHGTSTPLNDRVETRALRTLLGERAGQVPVSSTKSIIGHATVAAGALEAVATVLSIVHQTIHPTINYEHPDPECDLDYVPNQARPAAIDLALSNSFAFGGQVAALLVRQHAG